MSHARVPRRSILFAAVLAAWLLLVVGAAAAVPEAWRAVDERGATAADRVAPRTLNPFTAMDCVSASKAWAVSLEANVRTTDGGATWKDFSLPGEMFRYDPQAIDFVNGKVGYIVGIDHKATGGNRGVVLKTTNGGKKWTVKLRVTVDLLAGVYFKNTRKGWVVGRAGAIYKTTDGGQTWIAQSAPNVNKPTLYSVSFADATHGWAVGAAGTVRKTTNGGATWTKKSIATADLFSVDFISVNRGWTAGAVGFDNGQIHKTTNGGRTWQPQAGPGATILRPAVSIDFWNRNVGLAGAQGMVLYTTDGGSHWLSGTPEPGGIMVVGVKLANAKVGFAACTNYTILKTVDGGATWTTVLAPLL